MVSAPPWLELLSIASLGLAIICAIVIAVDLAAGHPQSMWIMNVVWPITALWAGPVAVWAYFRYGRAGSKALAMAAKQRGEMPPNRRQPMPVLVGKGTTHCGAGCTLGDIIAESLFVLFPLSLWGQRLFGAWLYDFILAFALGILFQYFTIKPMKGLTPGKGLVAAIKADTLSLCAWQLGMYGWMAIATFLIFGHDLEKSDPIFWFMMQLAMCLGFATSFPVNWWLLHQGIKEKM